jgi:hypothetical protein
LNFVSRAQRPGTIPGRLLSGKPLTLFLKMLYIPPMRPETQRSIEDIQQAIALLRRHL